MPIRMTMRYDTFRLSGDLSNEFGIVLSSISPDSVCNVGTDFDGMTSRFVRYIYMGSSRNLNNWKPIESDSERWCTGVESYCAPVSKEKCGSMLPHLRPGTQ